MPRLILMIALIGLTPIQAGAQALEVPPKTRIVLLGNGLGSRMMLYGHFETELHQRFPNHELLIRNMCDEGNTPGFRPHSARKTPFPFAGAEKFRTLSQAKDRWGSGHAGSGHYQMPDQWLTQLKADLIIAFFGYNESFAGPAGLAAFKDELAAFIAHSKSQRYNGQAAPQLALISPTAFQDLSARYDTPDGIQENAKLALYTQAMAEVAEAHKVHFVNLFAPTGAWFEASDKALTRDGALFTDAGYAKLAPILADGLFGAQDALATVDREALKAMVLQKNWMWQNYYKIPNGVHVFGRRHGPFGPKNYPAELEKLEQMVAARDQVIWDALAGRTSDLAALDAATRPLAEITSNYSPRNKKNGQLVYKSGAETRATLQVPEGYKIELFADEAGFPDLANPVQLSFDNAGRLWVATMPSYPHYEPGAALPNDKLIILEDTDGDGKADKQTTFVDGLHLPMGFEFSHDGVYVSQGYTLEFFADTDGDDKADLREVVMSGFDDHDTHHAISAFCADPSGAFLMGEGTFLHSHVETAYGPVRSSNGGFFRYEPSRRRLERSARLSIPNPWGIAFDRWGQDFFADTSDPNVRWMLPGSVRVGYGNFTPNPPNLLSVRVRPTSGLEFVSSRHFPDEVQGDLLINNTIGFQGTKQHSMVDEGTGYKSSFRHDLITGSDRNFRPVDMEFAPDGSLYVVDWHNALIGHMQHSARDPNRDHVHGRIFRVTYPSRPLVTPPMIVGASIPALLENLKLPEYRARYRTRRELRGRDSEAVLAAIKRWTAGLDTANPDYEHHLLEALWVSWGLNRVDSALLRQLLGAKNFQARAAAVRVLRYNAHRIPDQPELLKQAAADPHGRVRLEAIVAASWMDKAEGIAVLNSAAKPPADSPAKPATPARPGMDSWISAPFETALAYLEGKAIKGDAKISYKTHLKGADKKVFLKGAEIFGRDGYCGTCHQHDGMGLPAAQFPPIAGSKWVTGDETRLIKLVQHGLVGPLEVNGVSYPGVVPMTPFKHLSDTDMAAVLSFVRNAFGNKAPMISPDTVRQVRQASKDKVGFYQSSELLKEHPFE
jgi:glucose/arabinose dehydrogenase/mono/diheme cytochrome c family protein/lysophospholipase L1-like esterase